MKNLRANLFLVIGTLLLCCVLYPALLYGIGRVFFAKQAAGDGSQLIAQPFTNDEYFWPRPSANSFSATAAAASNWSANNPKLRDRVAQQLGPMIAYKAGSKSAGTGPEPRSPQEDIEAWAAGKRSEFVTSLETVDAQFFDAWLSDPANKEKAADLEPVPADMVTASGSGLDPHITLRNALSVYQLDRVAKKRSTAADFETVKKAIASLAASKAFAPLAGLVGEPLVNVLELNAELDAKFPVKGP